MCPAHSGLSQPWTCPKRHLLPFCSSPPRFLRPSVPNKIIISMQSPSLWLGGVCFLFCLFQLNLLCYQDDACPCIQHSERRASQVPGPTWRPPQLPTCLCKAIRLLVIDPASSSSCFPQKNTLPFGGGVRLPQYSNTNAHISIHDSEFPLDFIVWLCHLYLLSQ